MAEPFFRTGFRPLIFRLLWVLAGCLQVGTVAAGWWGSDDPALPRVQVAEPYTEWRTGPAMGYPVVRVSERGEWLQLVMRKTGWIKVRDEQGREGWVSMADIGRTLDARGDPVELDQLRLDDFSARRWETGLMAGDFEGAAVLSVYGGYWMTENLALELAGSQVLGNVSEILMVNANIVHQPFPRWRVSPFFTLGIGQVFTYPKATLAEPENRDNTAAHAGFGLRLYVSDRYFVRAEVKDYKVFTNRKTNEEATEWKVGLSVFF